MSLRILESVGNQRKRRKYPLNFLSSSLLLLLVLVSSTQSLHLNGSWVAEDDFFIFLSKFGFQKTEELNKNDTQGYIFGNITSQNEKDLLIYNQSTNSATSELPIANSSAKVQEPKRRIPRASVAINSNGSTNVTTNSSTPASSSKPLSLASSSTTTTKVPSTSKSSTSTTTRASTPSPPTTSTTTKRPKLLYYPGTLMVLDRENFLDFYKYRAVENKDEACEQMFKKLSKVLVDPQCNPNGTMKWTKVPCPKNQTCFEEAPSNVVHESQLTYSISDKSQEQFWYVSFVACYLETSSCKWKHSAKDAHSIPIDYSLWLVNGNPYTANENPLEYQFSFELQDTVEIYLLFFVCYLVLVPLQIHAMMRQNHILPKIFMLSLSLELIAVLANVIHVLNFAMDGEGHPTLAVFGDIIDIFSRAIFMLILLLLAKGWAITRTELTNKPFLFTIWFMYGIINVLLYVWNKTEVDVIEDIDEYQTWPGWIILIFRTLIMIWFIFELRETMAHEHHTQKLEFFLHFGAAALVWFIYLPIVALIALQISPLWRSKLILGITYAADCLGFAIMTHLLWPTRSKQYFLLQSSMHRDLLLSDELEEFDEAPHVQNPYSNRRSNTDTWYPVNSFHDREEPAITHNHLNGHSLMGSNTFASSQSLDKDNVPLIETL